MTFDPDEFLTGQKSQQPAPPTEDRELSLSERRAIAQRSKDVNYEATKRTAVGLALWMLVILGVAAGGLAITYWNYSKSMPPGFSAWHQYHIPLVNSVKESMHDPDSFEHIKTSWKPSEKGYELTMKFRGKNAVGGKVTTAIDAELGLDGTVQMKRYSDTFGTDLIIDANQSSP